ncbi:ABC transporter permease [Paraglaciecola sp. L3A3]|uniref:ABC transporter permease n=1 Tax=Paraglaciecola sp. L3A3 TaxID=2686358 RepID=UPI00131CACB1|nr:ABC transporter permease [Paraglaciecola sp. L3A3]
MQSIKKELLIVFSDLHSLAVLFIMPLTFMLIMTFAMSGRQTDILDSVSLYIEPATPEQHETLYIKYLEHLGYRFTKDIDDSSATLTFDKTFNQNILSNKAKHLLAVTYQSRTSLPVQALINQHLQLTFARVKLHLYMLDTEELDSSMPLEQQMQQIIKQSDTSDLFAAEQANKLLPSIGASIPSWLVFGIYFIVLPISITLINEKHSGTLIRLKTFPISMYGYFFSKLGAFFFISFMQFILLAIIGLRLIPLIVNAEPIAFSQILSLLPMGLFICLSAVCFAAIFAAMVKSFEQAIVVGGGINIILAALSGFMVPLDVMPPSLQSIAQFSPMYWSAELIKLNMVDSPLADSGLNIIKLCIFSLVSLAVSSLLFSRKIRELLWN